MDAEISTISTLERFGEGTAEVLRETWLMMLGRVSFPSYMRRMQEMNIRWIDALTYATLDTKAPQDVADFVAANPPQHKEEAA